MRCCLSPIRSGPLERRAARGDGRIRRGNRACRSRQEALLHAVRETRHLRPGKGCLLEAVPRSSPPRPSIPMQRTCWQAALPGRSLRPIPRGAELSAELGRLLQDDKTYRCLLTILGIGPKSASVLATSLFLRDSKLVIYCGLIPADHDCRSSIRSVQSAHKGNKALKNLFILSCNSLVGTKNRFGKHYDAWHRKGHEAQQGAQGSGPQEALRDLCGDARWGAVCGSASRRCRKVTCYGLTEP